MGNDPSTVSGVLLILNRFPGRLNSTLVVAIISQMDAI
jgi:hypothetical protein